MADANPPPLDVPVAVTAGTLALETGPLTARPGMLTGMYRVQVRLPPSVEGLRAVPLTVAAGGVPAGPLVWIDAVYQAGGLVWVK